MTTSRSVFIYSAALILGLAAETTAQKPKPPKPDVELKQAQKAAEEQQKAIEKATERQQKDVAKAQKDREKAIERAEKESHGEVVKPRPPRPKEPKAEEHLEHESFSTARQQSERLTKGIQLAPTQRSQFEVIRKRYDGQYRALEKEEERLDKTGASDAVVFRQLEALRARERADLRAMLTPAQQVTFDRNARSRAR